VRERNGINRWCTLSERDKGRLWAIANGLSPPVEHHRDGQYYPAFQQLIDAAEVTRVPLPPRSPNLNAYAERWVRSVKEECLSRLIRFGEASLRHALTQ